MDSFLSDKPRRVRQTGPPWVIEDCCQAWFAAPFTGQSPNSCLGQPSPHLARRRITRTEEPNFLSAYRVDSKSWDDLVANNDHYRELIKKLHGIFAGLCAYCEIRAGAGDWKVEFSIDHFRPRNPGNGHFEKDVTFDWANLMYCCTRCQKQKDNKWPGTESDVQYCQLLPLLRDIAAQDGWAYTAPSIDEGYVDGASSTSDSEVQFFAFDGKGRIIPNVDLLDDGQKSRALRTIYDIDLNGVEYYRAVHLANIFFHIGNLPRRRRTNEWGKYSDASFQNKKNLKDPPLEFPSYINYAWQQGWVRNKDSLPGAIKSLVDDHEQQYHLL